MAALKSKFVGQERLANPFGEDDPGPQAVGPLPSFWATAHLPVPLHCYSEWQQQGGGDQASTSTESCLIGGEPDSLQTSLGQGPPAPQHPSVSHLRNPLQSW